MADRHIAYYRVSTTKQGASGLGLEAQQEQVRRYVESVGGVLVSEHVEIESGTKNDRRVLAEALAACRRSKAKLTIAKLDRLARNVAFVSRLLESGTDFIACDMPSADRMMLQMLSVFAEHEARMISARTKAALAAAKARGIVLGTYGRVLADQHKADATNFAKTIAPAIEEARADGADTLVALAEKLNSTGHRTREGGIWYPMTVARVLRRIDPADQNTRMAAAA